MINDSFVTEFDNVDVDDFWFKQDGTTCQQNHQLMELITGKKWSKLVILAGI